MGNPTFDELYAKLNTAQKEAVDTIDGPVMVIAGPGTGKTQVLGLRIANILLKTDTKADGILCLTFTNSGVRAMRERLERFIGPDAHKVGISTFHGFSISLIEKHYELLDFNHPPVLLDDDQAVFLVDDILHAREWEYIRPRTNPALYFKDLKHLISLLKRERISADQFLVEIERDVERLKEDPSSISTRGESKGLIKKEIQKKIESLERTAEVVLFYRIYEEEKRAKGFMDYDDVLEYAVLLVEQYEDVRADIRENYLYVLVDEHQDSSGVQNAFLKAVWKDVESPNIFVVGDDRQLIYAFSGASLSYFEEFSHFFGKAKRITLVENYRSTAPILALADDLLKSSMTSGTLSSNTKGNEKIVLSEYSYPRDEIIGAGLYFKQQIDAGISPEECALLVPRNYHVREAISILLGLGVPVSTGNDVSLFEAQETIMLRRVLGIIAAPYDSRLIAESVLDPTSNIPTFTGHTFLRTIKSNTVSLDDLSSYGNDKGLFAGVNPIAVWGDRLKKWVNDLSSVPLPLAVSTIGNELLVDTASDTNELLVRIEIVRSFIHLATLYSQKKRTPHIAGFLEYLDRLESYGAHAVQAKFSNTTGVRVMTLHKSKGLEYVCVVIAHMNEETLMSEKKSGFTLPEKIKEHVRERDIEMAKRELYVAITRAKEKCIISYAKEGYSGNEMLPAQIIRELSDLHFIKKTSTETEQEILEYDPKLFTSASSEKAIPMDIIDLVRTHYAETKVSVTLLNNFFECPWKWYFRNFLQLPEVKNPSLIFGSIVHSTIEYILKSRAVPSAQELEGMIEALVTENGIADPRQSKALIRDAKDVIGRWVKNYYAHLSKDFISERPLSLKDSRFPHLLMYGKIDLTERLPDGGSIVTDFKTGSSKTTGVIEKIDEEGRMSSLMRQLAMYSYLIRGSSDKSYVAESRLLFLEADEIDKNAMYRTTITDEHIDLLVRDITDYDHMVQSGEWVNRPCNAKVYGSGNECAYCKKHEYLSI